MAAVSGPVTERSEDRRLLGKIAYLSLFVLALIAVGVVAFAVAEAAYTLLGTIVGGLLVNSKDVIGAIRESWSTRQVEKMSDQLGASTPATDNAQPVVVTNDTDAPVPVETKP